jgi:hypothetical protein
MAGSAFRNALAGIGRCGIRKFVKGEEPRVLGVVEQALGYEFGAARSCR